MNVRRSFLKPHPNALESMGVYCPIRQIVGEERRFFLFNSGTVSVVGIQKDAQYTHSLSITVEDRGSKVYYACVIEDDIVEENNKVLTRIYVTGDWEETILSAA